MSSYDEDDLHLHLHLVPEDVLIDILIRLPVESLLRFKCVCKHWYALIENPNFTHKHLRFQKTQNKGRLLLQHFNDDTEHYGYALFPDETLASGTYHDLDHFPEARSGLQIEGPINGLLCLFNNRDRIILWNPAMREFRFLPIPRRPPNVPLHFKVDVCNSCIGFGLDPLTDDYKVVLMLYFTERFLTGMDDQPNPAYVMVYTVTTNTWRQLEGLDFLPYDYSTLQPKSRTYLNGLYHWWTKDNVVLAFDMGKEIFREISGPDLPQDCFQQLLTLYNDHLALQFLRDPTDETEIYQQWIDIWVMEEEGSWIKQFSVAPPIGVAWLLGFWKNGELLFVTNTSPPIIICYPRSQLTLYNPSIQEIRDLGPKGSDSDFQAIVYYESLVSVKEGKYQRNGKLSTDFSTITRFPR